MCPKRAQPEFPESVKKGVVKGAQRGHQRVLTNCRKSDEKQCPKKVLKNVPNSAAQLVLKMANKERLNNML